MAQPSTGDGRSSTAAADPPSGRAALGQAVAAHSREIGAAVVEGLWGERKPSGLVGALVVEKVQSDAAWSAEQLGTWFCTGKLAAPQTRRDLASHGRGLADGYVTMTELTKSYLIWRDVILRIVAEEADRRNVDAATVAEAVAVVRHSCDAVLVGAVKAYDADRQHLQRQLDAEHDKLKHQALHDPLTGLANRTLLLERLEHALTRAGRLPGKIAVLYLDLDGFKEVNDRCGHHVGDQVLIEVGQRLLGLVRATDTVARLGGDEFVLLCEQSGGPAEVNALAERVRAAVGEPLRACPEQRVTVSVGLVLAAPGFDTDAMLRAADAAMYDAKQATEALSA
ncbi:MAG TPA: GGDEF domain-containing protein [Mycobacteriales bacterium]